MFETSRVLGIFEFSPHTAFGLFIRTSYPSLPPEFNAFHNDVSVISTTPRGQRVDHPRWYSFVRQRR